MSRKDYQLIADALRQTKRDASLSDVGVREGVDRAARMIANFLEDDNPRFDRARFLKAAE